MAEWCSITEVEYQLSVTGVSETTNDDFNNVTADTGIVDNAIINARLELSQYLVQKYDLSTITSANEWVKWATSLLAAMELMRRKGGIVPPGLQAKYDGMIQFLSQVQFGPGIVPGLSSRVNGGIALSNLTMDNSYGRAKIRRTNTISFPVSNSPLGTFNDRFDTGNNYQS